MFRSRWLLAGMVLAGAARALPASASPPSPHDSTVDPILMVCPQGDAVFKVVARNFVGIPMVGVDVVLTFGSCPAFPLCPDLPGHPVPYTIDIPNRFIRQYTNLQGVAELPIRMGGTCPESLVTVYGSGVLFGRRSVVSPDQNGDLGVDPTDLALLEAKLGQVDPTGDFDGDGVVTAADVAVLQAHKGHACAVATPVLPRTWGRLKLLYR
jgi:hypothetical protein